ncbi:MAG: LCP family protein [Elusimicrobia bacterium]|nr:LCP family protein [Elusimicrobiota bacterium]
MKKILASLILLIALAVSVIQNKSGLFKKIAKGERINLLLVGADHVRGGSHADVVLWVSYQPQTKFIDVVSIPRDALIKWDRWIPRKLGEILYLKTKRFGMSKGLKIFKRELENFLGVNFDYYSVVTFEAFVHFIDAIGAIPVKIETPMNYDDNWGNLHIHFEPGYYELSGKDALKYIRYRNTPLGDLGRMKRQQKFLRGLISRIISIQTVLNIPKFTKIYKEDILTNIDIFDVLTIADTFRTIDPTRQRYQILPGIPQKIFSKDVWRIDKTACATIVKTVENSKTEMWPRNKIKPFIIKKSPSTLEGVVAEVFNATNRRGIAEKLSKKLREYGCDVVLWGNWGSRKKHTEIISRTGNLPKAMRVAKVMGCNHITTAIDTGRMVDVSIVVGGDFPKISDEYR